MKRGPHFSQWGDLVKKPGIILNAAVLTGNANYLAIQRNFSKDAPVSVDEILKGFPEAERALVLRTLHWMVKIGLLQLEN